MGARGPAPTPTSVLKLRGSWRAKARKGEPQPDRTAPACPKWLDADARRAWRHLVPQLRAMGVLTRIDRNALARYCTLWARWRRAESFIHEHGEVYTLRNADGSVKYVQQFPQVSIAQKLAASLLRLEQEFGMTPSSRSGIRIEAGSGGAADGKDRFFAPAAG